jgi:hypothetical protein
VEYQLKLFGGGSVLSSVVCGILVVVVVVVEYKDEDAEKVKRVENPLLLLQKQRQGTIRRSGNVISK